MSVPSTYIASLLKGLNKNPPSHSPVLSPSLLPPGPDTLVFHSKRGTSDWTSSALVCPAAGQSQAWGKSGRTRTVAPRDLALTRGCMARGVGPAAPSLAGQGDLAIPERGASPRSPFQHKQVTLELHGCL